MTCEYTDDSAVIGFQVIVRLSNSNKLYVNQTSDRQASVSVEVKEDGLYEVAIFPISGDIGIVNSVIEYIEKFTVSGSMSTTTTGSLS